MERRDFLKVIGAASAASASGALAWPGGARAAHHEPGDALRSESREAFRELLDTLREVESGYLAPAYGITRAADLPDGHRLLISILEGGLLMEHDVDPERPRFERIVSPTRKFLGDNPDAVYFNAAIRGDRRYRVRGNMAGAVYVSITIESGAGDGSYATRVSGDINDTMFDVDANGNFEVLLGPDAPARGRLKLAPDATQITTRHYFEFPHSAAADAALHIPLTIEPLGPPAAPPPSPTDASVAENIRRVTRYVNGRTLGRPLNDPEQMPAWVSRVPNTFTQPEKPGDLAFAAVDQAYAMAPYVLAPDEALVIEGRFPKCRFANLVLWTRFLQSYDYANRPVWRNRARTRQAADGSFTMVVAHRDPGHPNWLDTEGRPSGTMYWRFMLPEEDVPTPQARVVKFADLPKA